MRDEGASILGELLKSNKSLKSLFIGKIMNKYRKKFY